MFASNTNAAVDQSIYWNLVHKALAELKSEHPGQLSCFITSLDAPLRGMKAGVVVETTFRLAAMRIVESTHRRSTPEEIEACNRDAAARVAALAEQENQRQNKTDLTKLSGAVAGAVADAMTRAARQAEDGARKK